MYKNEIGFVFYLISRLVLSLSRRTNAGVFTRFPILVTDGGFSTNLGHSPLHPLCCRGPAELSFSIKLHGIAPNSSRLCNLPLQSTLCRPEIPLLLISSLTMEPSTRICSDLVQVSVSTMLASP